MSKYVRCTECNELWKVERLIEIDVENPTECKNADTGQVMFFYNKKKICSQCKNDVDNRE